MYQVCLISFHESNDTSYLVPYDASSTAGHTRSLSSSSVDSTEKRGCSHLLCWIFISLTRALTLFSLPACVKTPPTFLYSVFSSCVSLDEQFYFICSCNQPTLQDDGISLVPLRACHSAGGRKLLPQPQQPPLTEETENSTKGLFQPLFFFATERQRSLGDFFERSSYLSKVMYD